MTKINKVKVSLEELKVLADKFPKMTVLEYIELHKKYK